MKQSSILVISICERLEGILDSMWGRWLRGSHDEAFWKKNNKQEAWRGGRGGYGRWVLHPVQRGLPDRCLCPVRPVSCPRMPMVAHVFRPDKHLCQQTAVTPPVRPFSPSLLCNYTPPPAVEGAGWGQARLRCRPHHCHQHHYRHVLEKQRESERER